MLFCGTYSGVGVFCVAIEMLPVGVIGKWTEMWLSKHVRGFFVHEFIKKVLLSKRDSRITYSF